MFYIYSFDCRPAGIKRGIEHTPLKFTVACIVRLCSKIFKRIRLKFSTNMVGVYSHTHSHYREVPGEGSLMEQDTIENVSWPIFFSKF